MIQSYSAQNVLNSGASAGRIKASQCSVLPGGQPIPPLLPSPLPWQVCTVPQVCSQGLSGGAAFRHKGVLMGICICSKKFFC